jgi:hypothetical protein
MNINTLMQFPTTFLKNISKDTTLGGYFVDIDPAVYTHMMTGLVSLILGTTPIESDKVRRIYNAHRELKCTRNDFQRFLQIFEETFIEIGANDYELKSILVKLKDIIDMVQAYKNDQSVWMTEELLKKLNTITDLNHVRDELIADVSALKFAIEILARPI